MRNKKLTLIELIIVVLVLGLLVGLAIPQFTVVKANADVASFKNDIDVLAKAIDESHIKEDTLPLREKVTITDPALLDVIYASGDSATNLYKVDLSKTGKYHFELKTKVSDTDYFIYSKETGKVFYTKGQVDGDNKTLYTLEYVGLTGAKLGASPLASGMSVPVTEPLQTITGNVPLSSTVEVKVNGADFPVTMENMVFEGNMDLMAAIKSKTFTSEAVLSTGMNVITIKVDSQVTNFKINLGNNQTPEETEVIKPVAVIGMTPEQGLLTNTQITWSYAGSTDVDGVIVAAEWTLDGVVQSTMPSLLAEGSHTIGLKVKDDKGLWSTIVNKTVEVLNAVEVSQVVTGNLHTVFLMSNGTVKTVGYNGLGQLGDGTQIDKSIPITIPNLTGVKSVAAGSGHTVFLMNDGTVKSVGGNSAGQLGNGTNTDNLSIITIPNLSNVKSISAKWNNTFFIMNDGTVKGVGDNSSGQLGVGSTTNATMPTIIPGISDIKSVSIGGAHTIFLLNDGTVRTAGYNVNGQLGDGTLTRKLSVVQPSSLSGVKSIEAGTMSSYFLLNDGSVKMCGFNGNGELGDGTLTNKSTPFLNINLSNVKSVSTGDGYVVFVMNNGSVSVVGNNSSGQLGNNSTTHTKNIISLSNVSNVKSVAAGSASTIFIFNTGEIQSVGSNTYGQLGDGTNVDKLTPVNVIGLH